MKFCLQDPNGYLLKHFIDYNYNVGETFIVLPDISLT